MVSNSSSPTLAESSLSRRRVLAGLGSTVLLAGLGSQVVPAQAAPVSSPVRRRLTTKLSWLLGPHDVGVAVKDLRSGNMLSYRGNQSYNLASVTKVITAMTLSRWVRARGRGFNATEQAHITKAITVSDNASQQWMWDLTGGWSGYNSTCRALGLSSGSKPNSPAGWGTSWSTPHDLVAVMGRVVGSSSPLNATDVAFIRSCMGRTASSQIWGVGAMGRASGRTIENKNGWVVLSSDKTWRINSIGHVRDTTRSVDYTAAIVSRGWTTMGAGTSFVNQVGLEIFHALSSGRL